MKQMFFWNSLAFSMIQQMLAIWFLVPLPFLKPAWTSGSSQFMYLKPGLENFEHYFTNMCNECDCVVVWPSFGIAFFLELLLFRWSSIVGNLISGSSAFSKSSLNIWKFTVLVLLKPGLENFEHYFTSVWNECNCAVVWAFFGIAFLWDWNENWPFPVLWPLLSFPNLLAYWVQHFHSIIF